MTTNEHGGEAAYRFEEIPVPSDGFFQVGRDGWRENNGLRAAIPDPHGGNHTSAFQRSAGSLE
ncbi:MAG: hypothetical protein IID45_10630 [Planctomycetes bacterium]|nr:hypothetical protein [Planctomycetota bacterium]